MSAILGFRRHFVSACGYIYIYIYTYVYSTTAGNPAQ